jgi:vitamin B12 transporter
LRHALGWFLIFLTVSSLAAQDLVGSPTPTPAPGRFLLDEIVVTADRWETSRREVASDTTILTAGDLERGSNFNLSEILRGVPALDVNRTGGPGGNTSVFLRGAANSNTLVLVDGVELNDPAAVDRNYDFSHLSCDNLERVEILRGPQSTLYGSDASGGVIQVFTRGGFGKPSASLSAEGGSMGTFKNAVSSQGTLGRFGYSGSLSRFTTDGISAADSSIGNLEPDPDKSLAGSFRSDFSWGAGLKTSAIYHATQATTNLDNGGGAGQDDPNSIGRLRGYTVRVQSESSLGGGIFTQKAGVSARRLRREYDNPLDARNPFLSWSRYDGRAAKWDWEGHFRPLPGQTLLLGFETEKESADSHSYYEYPSFFYNSTSRLEDTSSRTNGVYALLRSSFRRRAFITVGVRGDHQDRFGTYGTYRLAPALLILSDTKLRGSVATSFKAPSLYQLCDPSAGNPDLRPEESEGWDVGFDQTWAHGSFSGTYFHNRFRQMIDWVADSPSDPWSYEGHYRNVASTMTRGAEGVLGWRPSKGLSCSMGWTWQDTRDNATGSPLLRRPKQKGSLGVSWFFRDKARWSLDLLHKGKRFDYGSALPLPAVTLAHVSGSWTASRNVRFFARLENVFNRRYEEIRGYGTVGRSFFAGTALSL